MRANQARGVRSRFCRGVFAQLEVVFAPRTTGRVFLISICARQRLF